MNNVERALNKKGVVFDRWIIHLSKETAEFNAWYLPPETFQEDYEGFLACLALKRITIAAEERLKLQKRNVRAIEKETKELAKAAEKAEQAAQKAALRLVKKEKRRIKGDS